MSNENERRKSANKRKDVLLGEPHGTAANKLRKAIIFMLAGECGRLACYRCEMPIENERDLSIEHKASWQLASDPRAAFFELTNIAFSHLSCNTAAPQGGQLAATERAKTACPAGHLYAPENTWRDALGKRRCRACHRARQRQNQASWPCRSTEHRRLYG